MRQAPIDRRRTVLHDQVGEVLENAVHAGAGAESIQ